MVTEFTYWVHNHTVEVKAEASGRSHKLFHYHCTDDGPRPESYFEDYELVEGEGERTDAEKREMYWEMKTGAETGWDYSTRWMIPSEEDDESGEEQQQGELKVNIQAF